MNYILKLIDDSSNDTSTKNVLYIAMDKIVFFRKSASGSYIHLNNREVLNVRETPEEIEEIIKQII